MKPDRVPDTGSVPTTPLPVSFPSPFCGGPSSEMPTLWIPSAASTWPVSVPLTLAASAVNIRVKFPVLGPVN